MKGDESKHIIRDRGIEFVFYKETDAWWPRLLSENKKVHWLKVDFNKWRDEDESGDEGNFNENSYEDMMRQLGGGSEGFGNFNIDGADGAGDEEEEDDAEENLPDLE